MEEKEQEGVGGYKRELKGGGMKKSRKGLVAIRGS